MHEQKTLTNLPSRRQRTTLAKGYSERKSAGWVPRHRTPEPCNSSRTWFWQAIAERETASITDVTPATKQRTTPFLAKVLQDTLESNGNPNIVYPLLETHLDCLDERFDELVRQAAIAILPVLSQEQALELAAVLVNFGGLIWDFSLGSRGKNIEIAIACCETALLMLPCEGFSHMMEVRIHNNLALGYSDRFHGDRNSNLARSFAHYQKASQVLIRQPFPQRWCRLQSSRCHESSNGLNMAQKEAMDK